MSNLQKKMIFVFAALIIISVSVSIIACNLINNTNDEQNTNYGDLSDTPDGDTRLLVAMHDAVTAARSMGRLFI